MILSAALQEEESHVAALFAQNDGSPERVLAGLLSDLFGSQSAGKGKPTGHLRRPRHSQAFVAGRASARALRLLLSRALLRQLSLNHILDVFDLLDCALRLHFANREAARHAGAVTKLADVVHELGAPSPSGQDSSRGHSSGNFRSDGDGGSESSGDDLDGSGRDEACTSHQASGDGPAPCSDRPAWLLDSCDDQPSSSTPQPSTPAWSSSNVKLPGGSAYPQARARAAQAASKVLALASAHNTTSAELKHVLWLLQGSCTCHTRELLLRALVLATRADVAGGDNLEYVTNDCAADFEASTGNCTRARVDAGADGTDSRSDNDIEVNGGVDTEAAHGDHTNTSAPVGADVGIDAAVGVSPDVIGASARANRTMETASSSYRGVTSGPRTCFDLRGLDSGLMLPQVPAWPSDGYCVALWMRTEIGSQAEQARDCQSNSALCTPVGAGVSDRADTNVDAGNGVSLPATLWHFSTDQRSKAALSISVEESASADSNCGASVTGGSLLMLRARVHGDDGTVIDESEIELPRHIAKDRQWCWLCISHERRTFRRSILRVYCARARTTVGVADGNVCSDTSALPVHERSVADKADCEESLFVTLECRLKYPTALAVATEPPQSPPTPLQLSAAVSSSDAASTFAAVLPPPLSPESIPRPATSQVLGVVGGGMRAQIESPVGFDSALCPAAVQQLWHQQRTSHCDEEFDTVATSRAAHIEMEPTSQPSITTTRDRLGLNESAELGSLASGNAADGTAHVTLSSAQLLFAYHSCRCDVSSIVYDSARPAAATGEQAFCSAVTASTSISTSSIAHENGDKADNGAIGQLRGCGEGASIATRTAGVSAAFAALGGPSALLPLLISGNCFHLGWAVPRNAPRVPPRRSALNLRRTRAHKLCLRRPLQHSQGCCLCTAPTDTRTSTGNFGESYASVTPAAESCTLQNGTSNDSGETDSQWGLIPITLQPIGRHGNDVEASELALAFELVALLGMSRLNQRLIWASGGLAAVGLGAGEGAAEGAIVLLKRIPPRKITKRLLGAALMLRSAASAVLGHGDPPALSCKFSTEALEHSGMMPMPQGPGTVHDGQDADFENCSASRHSKIIQNIDAGVAEASARERECEFEFAAGWGVGARRALLALDNILYRRSLWRRTPFTTQAWWLESISKLRPRVAPNTSCASAAGCYSVRWLFGLYRSYVVLSTESGKNTPVATFGSSGSDESESDDDICAHERANESCLALDAKYSLGGGISNFTSTELNQLRSLVVQRMHDVLLDASESQLRCFVHELCRSVGFGPGINTDHDGKQVQHSEAQRSDALSAAALLELSQLVLSVLQSEDTVVSCATTDDEGQCADTLQVRTRFAELISSSGVFGVLFQRFVAAEVQNASVINVNDDVSAAAIDCMRACAVLTPLARWVPQVVKARDAPTESTSSAAALLDEHIATDDRTEEKDAVETPPGSRPMSETDVATSQMAMTPNRFNKLKDRIRRSLARPRKLSDAHDNKNSLALPVPVVQSLTRSHQVLAMLLAIQQRRHIGDDVIRALLSLVISPAHNWLEMPALMSEMDSIMDDKQESRVPDVEMALQRDKSLAAAEPRVAATDAGPTADESGDAESLPEATKNGADDGTSTDAPVPPDTSDEASTDVTQGTVSHTPIPSSLLLGVLQFLVLPSRHHQDETGLSKPLSEAAQLHALALTRRAMMSPRTAHALIRLQWRSQRAAPAEETSVVNAAANVDGDSAAGPLAGWLRAMLMLGSSQTDTKGILTLHPKAMEVVLSVGFHGVWIPDSDLELAQAATLGVASWTEGWAVGDTTTLAAEDHPGTNKVTAPTSDTEATKAKTKAVAFRLFLSEARAELGALYQEHAASARILDVETLDAVVSAADETWRQLLWRLLLCLRDTMGGATALTSAGSPHNTCGTFGSNTNGTGSGTTSDTSQRTESQSASPWPDAALLHLCVSATAALAAAPAERESSAETPDTGPGSVAWLRSAVLWGWGVLLGPAPTGATPVETTAADRRRQLATAALQARAEEGQLHALLRAALATATEATEAAGESDRRRSKRERRRQNALQAAKHAANSPARSRTAKAVFAAPPVTTDDEPAGTVTDDDDDAEQVGGGTDPFASVRGEDASRRAERALSVMLQVLEAVGALPPLRALAAVRAAAAGVGQGGSRRSAAERGRAAAAAQRVAAHEALEGATAAMTSLGRWGRGLANKLLGSTNAEQEAAEAEAARSQHTLGQGLGLTGTGKDEPPLLPRLQRPGAGENPHYHAVVWSLRECFALLERAVQFEVDAPRDTDALSEEPETPGPLSGLTTGLGGRFQGMGASITKLGSSKSVGRVSGSSGASAVGSRGGGGAESISGARPPSGTHLRPGSCAAALGRCVARLSYAVRTPGRRAQRRWGTYLLPAFRSLAEPVQATGDSEAQSARREALAQPELTAVCEAVDTSATFARRVVAMRWADAAAAATARARRRHEADVTRQQGAASDVAQIIAGVWPWNALYDVQNITASNTNNKDKANTVQKIETTTCHDRRFLALKRARARERRRRARRLRSTLRAVTLHPLAAGGEAAAPGGRTLAPPPSEWHARMALSAWHTLGVAPRSRSLMQQVWGLEQAGGGVATSSAGCCEIMRADGSGGVSHRWPWPCKHALDASRAVTGTRFSAAAALVLPVSSIEGELHLTDDRIVFIFHEGASDSPAEASGDISQSSNVGRRRRWSWRLGAVQSLTRRRYLLMPDAAIELTMDLQAACAEADDDDEIPDGTVSSLSVFGTDEEDNGNAACAAAALQTPTILFHFAVAPNSAAVVRAASKACKQGEAADNSVPSSRRLSSWAEQLESRWAMWRRKEGDTTESVNFKAATFDRCQHLPPAPPLAVEAAAVTRRFSFALLQRPAAVALRTRTILVSRALNAVGALGFVRESVHAKHDRRAACDDDKDAVTPSSDKDREAEAAMASANDDENLKSSSGDRNVSSNVQAETDFVLDASVLEATFVAVLDGKIGCSTSLQESSLAKDEPATSEDDAKSSIERSSNDKSMLSGTPVDVDDRADVATSKVDAAVFDEHKEASIQHKEPKSQAMVAELIWMAFDAGVRFRHGGAPVAWRRRLLSNFDYLLALNHAAGRTFADLNQYPIFPWVLSAAAQGTSEFDAETTPETLVMRRGADALQADVNIGAEATCDIEADFAFDQDLDLSKASNFRRLSAPVGALEPMRLRAFMERADALQAIERAQADQEQQMGEVPADEPCPRYLYGTHYSSSASVLYFLLRVEPYTSFARLQAASSTGNGTISQQSISNAGNGRDGFSMLRRCHLDHADRLLHSLSHAWSNCLSSHTDVKELVPELFSVPEVFLWDPHCSGAIDTGDKKDDGSPRKAARGGGTGLGVRQDGVVLGSVRLPAWASGCKSLDGLDARSNEESNTDLYGLAAHSFVRQHREALECNIVSKHLAHWFDLIFGHAQSGVAAENSHNLFHPLSYEGAVELAAVTDPLLREASRVQVAHFGQAPRALFARAHPQRLDPEAAAAVAWGWELAPATPCSKVSTSTTVSLAVDAELGAHMRDGLFCIPLSPRKQDTRQDATEEIDTSNKGWLGASLWASAAAVMGGASLESQDTDAIGTDKDYGWSFDTSNATAADQDISNDASADACADRCSSTESSDSDSQIDTESTEYDDTKDATQGDSRRSRWQLASPSPPHGTNAVVALLLPNEEPFGHHYMQNQAGARELSAGAPGSQGSPRKRSAPRAGSLARGRLVLSIDARGSMCETILQWFNPDAPPRLSALGARTWQPKFERSSFRQLLPPTSLPLAQDLGEILSARTSLQGVRDNLHADSGSTDRAILHGTAVPQHVAALVLPPLPAPQLSNSTGGGLTLAEQRQPLVFSISGTWDGNALHTCSIGSAPKPATSAASATLAATAKSSHDAASPADIARSTGSRSNFPFALRGWGGSSSTCASTAVATACTSGVGGVFGSVGGGAATAAVAVGFENGVIAVWRLCPTASGHWGLGTKLRAQVGKGEPDPWRVLFGHTHPVRCLALDLVLGVSASVSAGEGSEPEAAGSSVLVHALHDGTLIRRLCPSQSAGPVAPAQDGAVVLNVSVASLGYIVAHSAVSPCASDAVPQRVRAWLHTWALNGTLLAAAPAAEAFSSVNCGGRDGRFVVTCKPDRVWLWWTATLQMWRELIVDTPPPRAALRCAKILQDETCVVAGGDDGAVLVCPVPTDADIKREEDALLDGDDGEAEDDCQL